MNYLAEAHFKEEIPARAKRLYCKTFNLYHKLNGGDEDVALHLARRAVEKKYVKLNDRWYPKAAAEMIVRHDMDDDTGEDDDFKKPNVSSVVSMERRAAAAKRKLVYNKTLNDSDDESNDGLNVYDKSLKPPRRFVNRNTKRSGKVKKYNYDDDDDESSVTTLSNEEDDDDDTYYDNRVFK
ncbi:chaB2 [Euproctis pseudoconspersa nucleopolyhedrovirus]|uniref:ChaB2 n=1 Tax=Euproctis pseudoconspersa nucleopolyhedrovirus TaxID=307467 RepID=C3TWU0_9ABAC|nr:chaB2 [Euproctis pseudoconspersa nucleopolyhedrovirus]ACO53482.1 chaB2 [Euproctis pseudoconspersa nucleopolyhedrovirus]